ncbi:MAG: hypothetical protein JNL82_02695 [Myxococcales bacterium]|nr:hypothetical protein [Myxococcales bacterium]
MQRSVLLGLLLGSALVPACKDPATGDTDTEAATEATTATGSTTVTTAPPTTVDPPTTGTGETATTTPDVSSTGTVGETLATDPVTTGELTTGGGVCVPLECDGGIYACGDCMDNDGDGKFDTADPECVSPCDDREDTFATGLPGDNMDPCKQDCFFDGNSGGGKGDCAWNLACDPKGPGGDKCPYNPDQMNCPEEQSQECLDSCKVPNGCDCFGCCTVEVDGMAYDIYIGDEDCSLADIGACTQCSKNDDCDEDCQPENCEVCFGQELPPGCEDPTCPDGIMPCEVDDMGNSECPLDQFCNTGCCAPIQPG